MPSTHPRNPVARQHPFRCGITAAALLLGVGTACTQRTPTPNRDAAPAQPTGAPLAVKYGVLPSVAGTKSQEAYTPLLAAMGKAIGRPVQLHVAADYEALCEDMLSGKVHLAQVSAYLYLTTAMARARDDKPLHIIAQEERAEDNRYLGVFVVKPDSPFKAIADLKDKKIAYVDRGSSGGYYYPRMRIRALGHDPDAFFQTEVFAGSHDAVIELVKAGKADVGAVSELSSSLSGLRVVDKTAPIPDDGIVSLEGLSAEERNKLSLFFLRAHQNPTLANFFIARGLARYVAAVVEVYEPQRKEMALTTGALPTQAPVNAPAPADAPAPTSDTSGDR